MNKTVKFLFFGFCLSIILIRPMICHSQTSENSAEVQLLKPNKGINLDSVLRNIIELEKNCYYYKDSLRFEIFVYPINEGVGIRIDPVDYLYEIFNVNNDSMVGCLAYNAHYIFVYGDEAETLFTKTGETMSFSYTKPVSTDKKGVTTIVVIDDSRSILFYEYKNGNLRMVEYCPCCGKQ